MLRFLARAAGLGLFVGLAVLGLNDLIARATKHGPSSDWSQAVRVATPAVVSISTTRAVPPAFNPLLRDPVFRRLFEVPPDAFQERFETGLGSGVIIGPDGYVLTNHHVIANTDAILVGLADGREFNADVVGSDPETDLAVLAIDARALATIHIGDSDALEVGDVVLAIGNPLGFSQTVTQGIVSATGRNRVGITTFENFIQTDAAINPGNSGGALINTRGELVGINSAILSRDGGYQGIGLAIPSSALADIVSQIITRGYVERGWLGIAGASVPGGGVMIRNIFINGPADQAGLTLGDVLLRIDGTPITDARRALEVISALKPGTITELEVRRNARLLTLPATVWSRPRTDPGP